MTPHLADPGPFRCAEGPVWDAARGRLCFVDIEVARVHALDPGTGCVVTLSEGHPASALALNGPDDGPLELVVAGAGGLHLLRAGGERIPLLESLDGTINDVLAAPGGRLYAGTIHWGPGGMERPGKLLLIERDLSVSVQDDGIELANGLALSPDGRALFFADSAARRIHRYDVDPSTGALSGRRVLVEVPREEGIPDGLTVDAEGFLWSAQWYGGQVVRYDPDGAVERRVALPVLQVASLAFGGPDLQDLYITTAADPWPSLLAPPGLDLRPPRTGGPIYRLRTAVPGLPERRANLAQRPMTL